MAVGPSAAEANTYANGFDGAWVQLHVGEPGAAGTANQAAETTRQQVSLAAASGGQASSDADLVWTSISGSEDATHFSVWSASTGGTFRDAGVITADAYVAGNTFTIPSGSFTTGMATISS